GKTALRRRPEDITLWDVYLATESDEADDIFRMYDRGCPLGSGMHDVLRRHLEKAIDAMKESLSHTSIADLSAELREELGMIPSLDEILDYSVKVSVIPEKEGAVKLERVHEKKSNAIEHLRRVV
ncbi:MAG: hypothetical protein IJV47_02465, partial [Candidatus Methanomethylophilaceae archaeon]|nr:hypothetical protein [Candidatus Methanomethylophilaceae archaeon]